MRRSGRIATAAVPCSSQAMKGDLMSKPLTCWLGLHAWHPIESEPDFPLIACLRCGKQEVPNHNIAARMGWNQHMNG